MERIKSISGKMNKPKSPKIIDDSLRWLNFDKFFSSDVNEFRIKLRERLQNEVLPEMPEMLEKAEFPAKFLPLLSELRIGEVYCSKPYGIGKDIRRFIAAILELTRCDASLGTMVLVQMALLLNTIDDYGSEEQKKALLPDIVSFKLVGGWGLTEKDIGSDASSLKTTCKQQPDGSWIINGNKRWIGNANRDLMIVFAKDEVTQKVLGFIVHLNNNSGIKRQKIEHKMALRSVHNMAVEFTNLRVEEKWRLPKVTDFSSVTSMLAHSRLFVSWIACAIGIGVYDHVIRYLDSRTQFKKRLTHFQLIQEKLVRIMGNVQASLHLVAKLTELKEREESSIGKLALGKAWITLRMREVTALGREMLGGNGIILDNYAMKAFCDMEAIYTYEGTYDINSLVAGRELTGLAAFK